MNHEQLRSARAKHRLNHTRSAHRLVAELQQPLVDRLRLLTANASGSFTLITLEDAIAALTT